MRVISTISSRADLHNFGNNNNNNNNNDDNNNNNNNNDDDDDKENLNFYQKQIGLGLRVKVKLNSLTLNFSLFKKSVFNR